jgi:hypothetical protein
VFRLSGTVRRSGAAAAPSLLHGPRPAAAAGTRGKSRPPDGRRRMGSSLGGAFSWRNTGTGGPLAMRANVRALCFVAPARESGRRRADLALAHDEHRVPAPPVHRKGSAIKAKRAFVFHLISFVWELLLFPEFWSKIIINLWLNPRNKAKPFSFLFYSGPIELTRNFTAAYLFTWYVKTLMHEVNYHEFFLVQIWRIGRCWPHVRKVAMDATKCSWSGCIIM